MNVEQEITVSENIVLSIPLPVYILETISVSEDLERSISGFQMSVSKPIGNLRYSYMTGGSLGTNAGVINGGVL